MPLEPRDPALASIVAATVHVANGSGVVIHPPGGVPVIATAAHLVKESEAQRVWKGGVTESCHVVGWDEDLDVAVLTTDAMPPIAPPLQVARPDQDLAPGDAIWVSGFPSGWKDWTPVIVPGTVAGVGEDCWLTLDGTWGHSGGPVCRIVDGVALVSAILRGRAGPVHQSLVAIRGVLKKSGPLLENFRELVAEMERRGTDAAEVSLLRFLISNERANTKTGERILDLLEQHFRTGFVRVASGSDLRRKLP
jgi:hypothetical protein